MEQEIIEWANGIEPTKTIDDLKNGVALCYLISRELFQDRKQCELKVRVINCQKSDYQNSIRNLQFALQMIEESKALPVRHSTGQMLYQNPIKIFQILTQIKKSHTPPPKPPKAPSQKQEENQLFYVDENIVQPNHQPPEEPIANRYKMIKPNSPYSRNESAFSNQPQQSIQTHTQSLQQPDFEMKSQYPRSITHNTEYLEQSQKKNSIDSIDNITPIKDSYSQKMRKLEHEIKQLNNKIEREQEELHNDQVNISQVPMQRRGTSKLSKSMDFSIQCVSEEVKFQIIEWLKSIRLIKQSATNLQFKLPKICRNGVIFYDLINRLNGRDEVLKGALRNPKNLREIKHNYRRVLEYLKQFEKMNYRYLNQENQLAEGNEELFWGLLQDMRQFYLNHGNNANKNDTTQIIQYENISQNIQQQQTIKQQSPKAFQESQEKLKESTRKIHSPGPYAQKFTQKQEFESVNRSSNSLIKKSNINTSQAGTPVNQSLSNSRNFSTSYQKRKRSTSVSKSCVTREMELYVQTYFKQKQLYNNDNLFNDPIRNGEYLFFLLDSQHKFRNNFRSILDVEQNVITALIGVRAMADVGTLPAWVNGITKENVMQLDKQAMGLYWWMIKSQAPLLQKQIQQFTLPYKQEDIDQLKLITLHWIRETVKSINIQSFNDMIFMTQTGIVLCHAISQVLNVKVQPIYLNPIGEKQCLANIRKGLDNLKSKPIGQKFVWKEMSIYEGDQLIILGLYEDLRRFQDGLPQRQGDNYFEEGPYLNKIQQATISLKVSQDLQNLCKPLSLLDQNQIQVNKKLLFDEPQLAPAPIVKDWLPQYGVNINWNNEVIDELKDGLILCKLIQKLEKIEFRGINYKPVTTAACMANIKKAFSILKEKLDMPIDLVMEYEKVYHGDREYLQRLMGTIKAIYKIKINQSKKM